MVRKTGFIRNIQKTSQSPSSAVQFQPAVTTGIDDLTANELRIRLSDQIIVSDLYRLFHSDGDIEQGSEDLLRHILSRKPLDHGAVIALLLPHPARHELNVEAVTSPDDILFSEVDCCFKNCPCRHALGSFHYDSSNVLTGWLPGSRFKDQNFSGHFCFEVNALDKSGYLLAWLPDGSVLDRNLEHYLSLAASALSNIVRYKYLGQERAMLVSVLEHAADSIEITDEQAVIEYVNPAFEQATGYRYDEAVGKTVAELLRPPGADEAIYENMKNHIESGQIWKGTIESVRKDRSKWIVETTLSPIFNDKGDVCNHIAIKRDMTEQVRLHNQLSDSECRYRNLMDQAADAFYVHDLQGRFREVNQTACESLGYSREELLEMGVEDIEQRVDEADLYLLWESVQQKAMTTTGLHRRKDGSTFPVEITLGVFDAVGENLVLAMVRNISRRIALEEQLVRQANYDSLTGLPNRYLASERLKSAVAMAHRSGGTVAVMFLDMDGFKKVNDTFGHDVGDKLLQETAQRLQVCIREEDTVARLGGDEFMFVFLGLNDRDGAERITRKILEVSSAPYTLENQELYSSASIGVAFYPDDGESPELLMRHADTAMYRSKKRGRNCSSFYSSQMTDSAHTTIRMAAALRRALDENRLELHYQPIINNKNGGITGVEALIRWSSPDLGTVSADEIIRIAEEMGLIVRLGEWVLETACAQAKEWVDRLQSELSLAINVSVYQLRQPDFFELVESILIRTGWPAARLQLEVTETALLDYSNATLEILHQIHDLGVQWVIDDFGTGYSSLNYLQNFPFASLKVDRSFIRKIHSVSNNLKLVKAIIAMAKSFGLDVVAEGVENSEQYDLLASFGCEFTQGWYFSEALSGSSFFDYLQQNLRNPG